MRLLIISSLKLSENELQIIADEQGSNVEEMIKIVKENEEILDKMKVCRTHLILIITLF